MPNLLDEAEGRVQYSRPLSDVPPPEEPKFIVDARTEATKRRKAAESTLGPGAAWSPGGPLGGVAVPSSAVKPENKVYRAYGAIEKLFYDKRLFVGLDGPAGTGKSRGAMEKLHLMAEKYPGCRLLVARKTRESLSEAALFTYEQFVLPEGHPCLDGARRTHRQSYLYPNGSVINVAGLDKPQKIMSTEYDAIYVQEFIECDEDDLELLSSRLRNGVIPYQQLIFDCNPSYPSHWLKQRADAGSIVMHATAHEDNPRWWTQAPDGINFACYDWPDVAPDGRVGKWTEAGLVYLGVLDELTGARYLRLRKGIWAAAEGQIYDRFDPARSIVDHFDPPQTAGKWLWVVDYGFTKPFYVGVWWIDGDGRAYEWGQIYMTRKLVSEHAKDAMHMCGWEWDKELCEHREWTPDGVDPSTFYRPPLPDYVISDHDAEGKQTFEEETGLKMVNASKSITEGINATQERFKPAGDGRPRIFFMRGSLYEEDSELKKKKLPLRSTDEIEAYVWDPKGKAKERPIDEYNHAMDGLRYLVCDLDDITGGVQVRAKEIAMGHVAQPGLLVAAVPSSTHGQFGVFGAPRISRRQRIEAGRRR